MTAAADIAALDLAAGRFGAFDVACPSCGPERRSPANRTRKVLRVWHHEPGFATYHCARCGAAGYDRDDQPGAGAPAFSPAVRAEIKARDCQAAAEQRRKAQWLWSIRRPAAKSIVERYLREVRGIVGAIPPTIGFMPATDTYPPAIIAAFGIPDEHEPGILTLPDDRVVGVHLTKLQPDGSGKQGDPAKIMVGRGSLGSPIVLAPMNDSLGLAVVEGVETGLSIRDATGLGVWAAGAASRMPAIADAVPDYVDCATVVVEDDEAGRRHAGALLDRLGERGIAEPMHLASEVA